MYIQLKWLRRGLRNAQIKQDYDMKTKPKDITMALTAKVRTLDLASFVIIYFSETCRLVERIVTEMMKICAIM